MIAKIKKKTGIKPTRYMGFITDPLYLSKEADPHQRWFASTHRRIYGDEHMMCFGMPAFARAQKVRIVQDFISAEFAESRWLKLV